MKIVHQEIMRRNKEEKGCDFILWWEKDSEA